MDSSIAPLESASALAIAASNVRKHDDRAASLPRRFLASSRLADDIPLGWNDELAVACREGVAGMRQASRAGEKALDGAAECERVRAAQLSSYAHYLDDVSVSEDDEAALQCALALLAGPDALPSWALRLDIDAVDAVSVVDKGMRVRDGVDVSTCVVSGKGLAVYDCGASKNVFSVRALDACGDVVETVEEEDVSVCVEGDGVGNVSVRRVEDGLFECVYGVAVGCITPLSVTV